MRPITVFESHFQTAEALLKVFGSLDDHALPIDYPWTYSHVTTIGTVVQACDALAQEAVGELQATAGVV